MATGDKLVNLDELKLVYDKLHVPSVQVQIPTGQWSGSSTRTYTVNATGVTADTIVDWAMDSSINYLTSDLTVTPGSGTITFSTTALPAGTINVTLFFPGVNGEVVIQTLADVYSKSQTDQKISDAQRVYLRGTFSGDFLTSLKSLSPGVWYYKNSNVTSGGPQGASYGSYTIFVSEDRIASIYFAQQSAGIVAVANGIAIDTATTIPWTILRPTENTQLSPTYDTSKIDSITAYRNGKIVFVSMQIAAGALPAGYSYIQCNLGVSFVAQPNIVFCSQGTADDAKVFGGYFLQNTLQIRASASNSGKLLATFVGITS